MGLLPSAHVYCLIFLLCASVSECVHSRVPNSRVIEARLNTIYLPTMANFAFGFSPRLRIWQFAFRMEACESLIWSDFHWFCTQLLHLAEADCSSNYHYTLALQNLPFRVISEKFIEWHYSAYPIYVFLRNQAQSLATDCPHWSVWLWSEIYSPVKLRNDQINRSVFDVVCCIQAHLLAPLFYVHP